MRKREEAEERWEKVVGPSVGGGTFTTEVKCPQCGGSKASVHTVQSGGTYAQERYSIQKYVCLGCNYTWKTDG